MEAAKAFLNPSAVRVATGRLGGFTVVELMAVVAVIALLAMIGIPSIARARQNAEDAKTQKELHSIYTAIVMFETENGRQPTSLSELRPYITVDETKYELNLN